MKILPVFLVLCILSGTDATIQCKTRPDTKKNASKASKGSTTISSKQVGTSVIVSVVTEQNQRISLPSRKIGGKIYTSISILSQQLSTNASTETNRLIIAGSEIRCVASGFLVSGVSKQGTRMAQMKMPALLLGYETFVPIPDFFYALDALGIYEVEATQQLIVLNPYTSTLVTAQIIDSRKPFNTLQPEKLKEIVPVYPTDLNETAPSRYRLPQDLKRRELDTVKRKDGAFVIDSVGSKSIASLLLDFKTSPNSINKVYPKVEGGKTTIHFESEREFETPEPVQIQGRKITVCFPNAVNGQQSLKEIRKLNFESVKTYLDSKKQVYIFTLKKDNRTATLEKVNDKHYVLTITPVSSDAANSSEKKKWNLDCIVLDAGHGGKDSGAESINGAFEKDVALKVVHKLRDEIHKLLPNTKIVLTRNNDTFVELWERGEIANKAGGKFLISVHCNSMPTKPNPANGFEVYVLSPARTDDAVNVANAENSVIKLESKSDKYKSITDDQLILATLAQNSFVKLSQQCATYMQSELGKSTTLHNRGVNQAAFIVLIGAAMPSVYLEIGFLSNANDQKILTGDKGQTSIAKGIANAVKRYAESYKNIVK